MVAYVLCDRVIECVQERGNSLPGWGCSGSRIRSLGTINFGLEMGSWEVVCFYSSFQVGNW